jgi:opacity protein-like surface antigen
MSAKRGFLGAVGFLMLASGIQLPAEAQTSPLDLEPQTAPITAEDLAIGTVSDEATTANTAPAAATNNFEPAALLQPENLSAQSLITDEATLPTQTQAAPTADQLAYPIPAESSEIAQARRRTRNTVTGRGPDFLGIGGDFGTADDASFAVISKLSLSDQVAIRPSVLIGNDFAVLAPVTYEFSGYSANVEGFQIRPYAGVGASYIDSDDSDSDSNIGLLLAAGVDVPLSRQFTVNAQANYAGIFNDDSNFGVTVGIGYNFGNLLR